MNSAQSTFRFDIPRSGSIDLETWYITNCESAAWALLGRKRELMVLLAISELMRPDLGPQQVADRWQVLLSMLEHCLKHMGSDAA
jgi:hypothetical protein